jgi:hypothetical protein
VLGYDIFKKKMENNDEVLKFLIEIPLCPSAIGLDEQKCGMLKSCNECWKYALEKEYDIKENEKNG